MDEWSWKWLSLGLLGLCLVLGMVLVLVLTAPPHSTSGQRLAIPKVYRQPTAASTDSSLREEMMVLENENEELRAQLEDLRRMVEDARSAQAGETVLPASPKELGRSLGRLALQRQALRAAFPAGPPPREDPRLAEFIRGQQELASAAVPIQVAFQQNVFMSPSDVAELQTAMLTEALGLNPGQSNQIRMTIQQIVQRYAAAGVSLSPPPEGVDRRAYFKQLREMRREINQASRIGLTPDQVARLEELGLDSPWSLGRF